MPVYRAYVIGESDRFEAVHELDCADDEQALEQARSYLDGHDVEVWERSRLVKRLKHPAE